MRVIIILFVATSTILAFSLLGYVIVDIVREKQKEKRTKNQDT